MTRTISNIDKVTHVSDAELSLPSALELPSLRSEIAVAKNAFLYAKEFLIASAEELKPAYIGRENPEADEMALTSLRDEAIELLIEKFSAVNNHFELVAALSQSTASLKDHDALSPVFEDLSVLSDFYERIEEGIKQSSGTDLPALDNKGQSYELMLISLSQIFKDADECKPALHAAFTKFCDDYAEKRFREITKLPEHVAASAPEEAVEGAGRGIKSLLTETRNTLQDTGQKGINLAKFGFSLVAAGAGCVAYGVVQTARLTLSLLDEIAGRLGAYELLNKLRQEVTEPEERSNDHKLLRSFFLRLPAMGIRGGAPRMNEEENDPRTGLAGAKERKSQVGIRPLYENDEASLFAGEAGAEIGQLPFGIGRSWTSARIVTDDDAFDNTLHNTDTWVVTGKDGSLTRIEKFISENLKYSRSETPLTIRDIYPEKNVPNLPAEGRKKHHYYGAEITARIYPGTTLTLPLSAEYTVRELAFLDRRGRHIESPDGWKIREGIFGSFKIKSPSNARHICYVVSGKTSEEAALRADVIKKLSDALPVFSTYHGTENQYFRKALDLIPNPEDRGKLWYHAQRNAGFIYTMDPFLSRYQRAAGTARAEAIAGTRMGICDSFAFYVALESTALGMPTTVLSGPVVKGNRFQFNPGHAVAASAEKDRVRQMDLTCDAESDSGVSRWNMNLSERRRVLSDLVQGSLTNRTVLETSSDLHYLLRGSSPPGKEGNFTAPSPILSFAMKKLDNGINPSPKLPHISGESTRDIPLRHKLTGVEALTQKWYLAELYREAGEKDTLRPMYSYLQERGAKTGPSAEGLTHLPGRFESLTGFNGLSEVVSYTRKAILPDGAGTGARQDAINWLINISTPPAERESYLRWPLKIRQSDYSAACSPDILANFSDEQLLSMTDNLLNITSHILSTSAGHTSDFEWEIESKVATNADILTIHDAGSRIVESIIARKIPVPEETAFLLAAFKLETAFALISNGKAGDSAALAELTLESISIIEQSAGLEKGQLMFRLFSHTENTAGSIIEDLMNRLPGDSSLRFPDLSEGAKAELISSGADITNWQMARYWADKVGARINMRINDELEAMIVDSVKDRLEALRAAGNEGSLINWPESRSPGSAIIARLSEDPYANLWRDCAALEKMGFSGSDRISAVWPVCSEEDAVRYLLTNLRMSRVYDFILELDYGSAAVPYQTLYSHCSTMHREFLKDRPGSGEVLALADITAPALNETDRFFSELRDRYPEIWGEFIDSHGSNRGAGWNPSTDLSTCAARATAERLFNGISAEDIYHAFLWLGCQRIYSGSSHFNILPDQSILKSSPIELSAMRESWARGTAALAETIAGRGFYEDSSNSVISDIPVEAKGALIAATSLFRLKELTELCITSGNLPNSASSALSFRLTQDNGRQVLSQLWSNIINPEWDTLTEQFRQIFKETKAGIERKTPETARYPAPYSRYLLSENPHVRPRAASGAFEEYRNYVTGDDVKRVDWKASAKSDRILMRKYREDEIRPVKIILDPEWLTEGLTDPKKVNRKRLEAIFTHILLAEIEKRPVDLIIKSRAGYPAIVDLHKSGVAHTKGFLNRLAGITYGVALAVQNEKTVYGRDRKASYNILFDECNFPRESLLVCGIAKANLPRSFAGLNALKKRGAFIHMIPGHIDSE